MYFESHAHYDDKRFNKDREDVFKRIKENKISYVVNIGHSMESSKESINLAMRHDFIYATVGVHPHNASRMTDDDLITLKRLAREKKVVGIGEIGLDFFRDLSPRDVQKQRFIEQLNLSCELGMPVVIHERDAKEATFDIVKKSKARRGVVHCFSGTKEMAARYVNLGYMIGIGGVITYHNAKNLVEVCKETPLSHILIETDSPYLTPEPNRTLRNDSQNLVDIVDKIAYIKQITPEKVAEKTMENGKLLFDIK